MLLTLHGEAAVAAPCPDVQSAAMMLCGCAGGAGRARSSAARPEGQLHPGPQCGPAQRAAPVC